MSEGVTQLFSNEYPPLLREIPQPPKHINIRGVMPSYDLKFLTVVGARAVTSYGESVIKHLFKGLAGYPIVIVSGLAYGVDTLAHNAALENNLLTIGVPGSGLDWNVLYPRVNVSLARRILESNGALISEFENNLRAADWSFPKRNRIMAGMSHATLMIEAREKSGSLITAKLATDFNRELLVVPGSIFSNESRGTHQFLKLGATAVTESNDILRALGLVEQTRDIFRADMSEAEIRVLNLVASPIHREQLIEQLALPITEVQVLLTTMELKGLIVEELGFVRAG
ncbi:MAG: protecting protein DprA [Candidatus Kaiserbacteria bacterium]|nr:protecting protein DprA [Candidatus Kaiserbacteria bacterium]